MHPALLCGCRQIVLDGWQAFGSLGCENMYLHRIALRDIRGFEALDFDLQRPDGGYAGWTVFTGDNGSGKSTLSNSDEKLRARLVTPAVFAPLPGL